MRQILTKRGVILCVTVYQAGQQGLDRLRSQSYQGFLCPDVHTLRLLQFWTVIFKIIKLILDFYRSICAIFELNLPNFCQDIAAKLNIVTYSFFFFFFRSIDGGRRQIATIFFYHKLVIFKAFLGETSK